MNYTPGRPYVRAIPEFKKRGIGRTKSFEIIRRGLVEAFKLDGMLFVYLDSLDSLPERLAAIEAAKECA